MEMMNKPLTIPEAYNQLIKTARKCVGLKDRCEMNVKSGLLLRVNLLRIYLGNRHLCFIIIILPVRIEVF